MKLVGLPLAMAALLADRVLTVPTPPVKSHGPLLIWNATIQGYEAPSVTDAGQGAAGILSWSGKGRKYDAPRVIHRGDYDDFEYTPPGTPYDWNQTTSGDTMSSSRLTLSSSSSSPHDETTTDPHHQAKDTTLTRRGEHGTGPDELYPPMTEREDLLRRFELLECWDLNQMRAYSSGDYDCGRARHWVWRNIPWEDPYDIWLNSNVQARHWIWDSKNDVRRESFKWEAWVQLAHAARGWYPIL